ncbi:MAG: DnaJ domain-containing protein [Pseudonocardiaceae bacterium]
MSRFARPAPGSNTHTPTHTSPPDANQSHPWSGAALRTQTGSDRWRQEALLQLQANAGNRATSSLFHQGTSRAGSAGQPVVQRALTPVFPVPPAWYAPFQQLAEKCNELLDLARKAWLDKSTKRQAALAKLGQLERAIYDWFGQQQGATVATTPDATGMRNLLNQMRQERVALVTMAIKGNGDPPLAHFRLLDSDEQARVRAIWRNLLSAKGIGIEGGKAFRAQVLADFARLLETATGRMVTEALVGESRVLTITPTTQAKGKFAAAPVDAEREGIEAVDSPDPRVLSRYVALDFTPALSVQQRKQILNDVRLRRPAALGFSVTTSEGTRYFRFNQGTASTMTVPEDAQDASLHPSSRLLGVHGEEIIAPVFANLGHELGHVLRSLHGIGGSSSGATALVQHAFPGAVDPDMRTEEFFNIDAVENRIREEAGLSRRAGHTNLVARELVRLHEFVDLAFTRAQAALQLRPGPFREPLQGIVQECDEMRISLFEFGKHGGDPADLQARATALAQRSTKLDEAVRAQNALVAPRPGARVRPPDTAYLLLGLAPGAAHAEALAAYKRLARRWHPDRNLDNTAEAAERFKAIRAAYDQINDWNSGGAAHEPRILTLQRSFVHAPVTVQRFGVDDRQWGEVISVRHLGATAYALSTLKNESVVIKRAGTGAIRYNLSEEGPVQEVLAAKLGEMEGLGVTTARTVMIETGGAEGKEVLMRLQALGPVGSALAGDLADAQAFLVMQHAPGLRADKAGHIIAASSRDDRIQLFYRLGRLWAFDVLINNTDRFSAGNWGNVILGPRGSVVGIDQMIGLVASNAGAGFAGDEAMSKLRTALDPGRRRKWAQETFQSLSRHLGPDFAALEGVFVLQFERGALEGIDAVAALKPHQLAQKQAELPEFAQEVAGQIGLAGAAVIKETLSGSREEIGRQLTDLYRYIGDRERLAGAIDAELAEPRRQRDAFLDTLGTQAEELAGEWAKVDTWWTGKDAHWDKRIAGLTTLWDSAYKEFVKASRVKGVGALQAQLQEWAAGITYVWEAANGLRERAHRTIKPLIDRLGEVIQQERGRVPILERV